MEATEGAFGADVDFAQLVKIYGSAPDSTRSRCSPAECAGIRKRTVEGDPVSTSYVKRQNLTMRMHIRRFTRLTNAFSKKFENHAHMVALYTVFYNYCHIHNTLRVTPAMEAGLSDTLRDMEWIAELVDARAPKPDRPKSYRKKIQTDALHRALLECGESSYFPGTDNPLKEYRELVRRETY